jgi:hypothetical protein
MTVSGLGQPGRLGSLTVHDASIGAPCGLCGGAMKVGDIPAMVTMPGPDNDGECTARDGQIVHETCLRLTAAGEPD